MEAVNGRQLDFKRHETHSVPEFVENNIPDFCSIIEKTPLFLRLYKLKNQNNFGKIELLPEFQKLHTINFNQQTTLFRTQELVSAKKDQRGDLICGNLLVNIQNFELYPYNSNTFSVYTYLDANFADLKGIIGFSVRFENDEGISLNLDHFLDKCDGQFQGSGLGSILINQIKRIAFELKVDINGLFNNSNNLAYFYIKNGFKIIESEYSEFGCDRFYYSYNSLKQSFDAKPLVG